jgi:hypothetical protein
MFGVLLFLIYFSVVSIAFFAQQKWWVRVETQTPACIYYFGPFDSSTEAEAHSPVYLHDLEAEGAQGIRAVIERCCPRRLTISQED